MVIPRNYRHMVNDAQEIPRPFDGNMHMHIPNAKHPVTGDSGDGWLADAQSIMQPRTARSRGGPCTITLY